ncbi:MAG TPA: DUF5050 domain-containing protein [Phycisphaerae bacterium]|nr:DUF5050 domain-containing protein [Phycisphaerae bacterium]
MRVTEMVMMVVVVVSPLLGFPEEAYGSQIKMYWTDMDGNAVGRANLDGSGVETVVSLAQTDQRAMGLAVDVEAGKVYWSDIAGGRLHRANLDGSGAEELSGTSSGHISYVALDVADGKVYWTASYSIRRANMDGSDMEIIVSALQDPRGIDLDLVAGHVYWAEHETGKITRANLNGTDVTTLIMSPIPWTIELDVPGDKMYWTDRQTHRLYRANLNGSSMEEMFWLGTNFSSGQDIALDLPNGKVYYTDHYNNVIRRANFDGSMPEDLVTGVDAYSVLIIPEPATLALLAFGGLLLLRRRRER